MSALSILEKNNKQSERSKTPEDLFLINFSSNDDLMLKWYTNEKTFAYLFKSG